MTLTDLEHVAVVLTAATLLAAVGAVAVVTVRLRRRWRRRRSLLAAVFARGLAPVTMSRLAEGLTATVGSPSWWVAQRERHEMWRAVAAAQRSVAVAVRANAPVGELPALTRQLQQAAGGVDAALRASAGQRPARDVTADRLQIVAAAADIRTAAVTSLDATRVDVRPVVSAIAVEVAALAAGVQSARSLASTAK